MRRASSQDEVEGTSHSEEGCGSGGTDVDWDRTGQTEMLCHILLEGHLEDHSGNAEGLVAYLEVRIVGLFGTVARLAGTVGKVARRSRDAYEDTRLEAVGRGLRAGHRAVGRKRARSPGYRCKVVGGKDKAEIQPKRISK